eukprot:CAMPEP_0205922992 /NCGR_PEP_ID=MMETSP1325-20131115/15412_1 /ASSEMBLY_ACC=CAM_ASM_000708 /TAXON_ID=236786 /ORGANISM="Florenciella sp., Strain RCC1007" /LENGTH=69 /DNA_ID=CAMNT_0053291117 /DNA_START=83 /DNA_END=288 /DNA_ORIENTATION=-
MKYLAVYLMLQLGGNDEPSEADVSKALTEVGIEVDAAQLAFFFKSIEGKDVDELMAMGASKLGGGGGGG